MLRGSTHVVIPRMTEVCKECGCNCNSCFNYNSLDLHHEIETLRSKLKKSDNHILQMERDFVDSREYAEQEISKLQDELAKLRDRYDRLFESHKKLQRLNHNLEDKLLKVVNKFDTEKTALQKDVANVTSKLVDAKVTISELEEENDRYRNDCNLAVQMLQCKPSNFVAHKLNTLPLDLQERVKCHMTREQIIDIENAAVPKPETKMIRVPMATFPPTAMVYSINKIPPANSGLTSQSSGSSSSISSNGSSEGKAKMDSVPTHIIAKVLTQPERKRKPQKLYICNRCKEDFSMVDKEVQTCIAYTSDSNGYHTRTAHYHGLPPGVHRPRLNSTETEI